MGARKVRRGALTRGVRGGGDHQDEGAEGLRRRRYNLVSDWFWCLLCGHSSAPLPLGKHLTFREMSKQDPHGTTALWLTCIVMYYVDYKQSGRYEEQTLQYCSSRHAKEN